MFKKYFLIVCLIALGQLAGAQAVEKKPEEKSSVYPPAKKAALYGLIPGGGQVYNKSYWKVPIVYAGFGALTYSFMFYNKEYGAVRQAYIQKINGQTVTNPEFANVPENMLYNVRESYRKSRDLSAIGMVGWYAFAILDATVEAHLKGFDVGDNLSFRFKPDYQFNPMGHSMGIKLQARF